MLQIHKYTSNTNTNTHGKTINTQIQKYRYTQIQILPLAVLSRSEEEKNEIFLKNPFTKTAVSSVPEEFRKVPGCQNDPLSQGKIPPSKVESAKNLFMGEKVVRRC